VLRKIYRISKEDPSWRLMSLPAGHDVVVRMSEELTAVGIAAS
jgi:hypothetical protein